MKTRIVAVLAAALGCACQVVEPPPPPGAPRIERFEASQSRVVAGGEVTLTFSTAGATKVELTDDLGAGLELSDQVASGTVKVLPTRTTFYVLQATGAGGRDVAFVQVAVDEPLKEVFLIAVPSSLEFGEKGQLLWGAAFASSATLKTGSAPPMPLTGRAGAITVMPTATEQYQLTARGTSDGGTLSASASIQVRPVFREVSLSAAEGIQPGKPLSFTWTAGGAASLSISEQVFGEIHTARAPEANSGSYDYVLPARLPNGIGVADGLPLHFVLSATSGSVTVTRRLTAVVGELPAIVQLDAPESVSVGGRFTVAWRTLNATQVAITAGGLPVFRTPEGAQSRVDQGSVSLAAPLTQSQFTLVASNHTGLTSKRVFSVRPVAPPVISTYTLTPTINALGDPATARWTTTNAQRVQLRFEDGANLAVIENPAQVASGSVVLTPATEGRIVLEAYNAAGDRVSQSKPLAFATSPVSLTPTPAERGSPATLSWRLAPSVLEVVGLPTSPGAPIPNSPRFIDLSTATMPPAQELQFADPTDGAEKLTPPEGFRFPFLGEVRPELFVSVNGFIAFARPGALASNSDLSAAGSIAPSMLAPLWDDLTLGMGSKILYGLRRAPGSGERFLIVQWDKVQLAGDNSSELTFQVHLSETGQVAFLYRTLTGSLGSVTIGIKDRLWPVAQQFTFNSMATLPTPDLELNYFGGGPADGTSMLTATRSRRVEFFGKTATGLVPASVQLRSFGPGDVKVTEAMPVPEPSVSTTGQWIELKNDTEVAVDFDGLSVDSTGSSPDGGFLIPAGTVVPAGGYLVLGQSTDVSMTGGAPVTLLATDVPLQQRDRLRVRLRDTVLGELTWDAGVAGTSVVAKEVILVATGHSFTCSRMVTFGPAGALGTPGAANEACAPYALSSIPGAFVAAPAGTEVFANLSGDDGYGEGTLPIPFTYFGVERTTFGFSNNGFITLGAPLTTAGVSNDMAVSTSQPNGVLAVFWDDLLRDTGKNALWRQGDRTIITWENYRPYGSGFAGATLNAQIHLLDNGVIEFHYGNIGTTSTDQGILDRLGGSSATVWIERPDGAIAIPQQIGQPNGVVPNSGLRFTPKP